MGTKIPRSPWGSDFPDAFVHSQLKSRNAHSDYLAAKSGDAEAAKSLVETLISGEETEKLGRFLAGKSPILLAVTADEVAGFNAIPDAMAQSLGSRLALAVS